MRYKIKRVFKYFIISLFILLLGTRIAGTRAITSYSQKTGISCYKDNSSNRYKYKPCDVFKAQDWVRYIDMPNNDSEIVLYLQGGPVPTWDGDRTKYPDDAALFFDFTSDLNPSYDFAIVKEIWHMKNALAKNTYKLSLKNARKEQEEYMHILNKIVKHYQGKGKKVILAGHSYGGNQVNHFLNEIGTTADGFISLASRINVPEKQKKLWASGISTNYTVDGKLNNPASGLRAPLYKLVKWSLMVKDDVFVFDAATVSYNHIKKIDPSKMTHKNIYWDSAEGDVSAGWFTKEEQEFAKKYGTYSFIPYSKIEQLWTSDESSYTEEDKRNTPHSYSMNMKEFAEQIHKQFAV